MCKQRNKNEYREWGERYSHVILFWNDQELQFPTIYFFWLYNISYVMDCILTSFSVL